MGLLDALAPSLITAGAGLLGGYFQQQSHEEDLQAAEENKKQDMILQLQLAELKEKYNVGRSSGGGGGGGGSDRTAQLLNAYQNYIASNRAARDRQSAAFQELGKAATAPLLK